MRDLFAPYRERFCTVSGGSFDKKETVLFYSMDGCLILSLLLSNGNYTQWLNFQFSSDVCLCDFI